MVRPDDVILQYQQEPGLFMPQRFVRFGNVAFIKINAHFSLKNFIQDHFHIIAAMTIHQRALTFNKLRQAVLYQGAELKASAKLVYNFVALDGFDHEMHTPDYVPTVITATIYFLYPAHGCRGLSRQPRYACD